MESAVLLVALFMQSAVVAFTRMTSHEGSRARSCGDTNNPRPLWARLLQNCTVLTSVAIDVRRVRHIMTRVIVTFQNDPVVIPIRVELDKLQAVPPPDKPLLHKCLLVSFSTGLKFCHLDIHGWMGWGILVCKNN